MQFLIFRSYRFGGEKGFTLIEIIMVILLLGIIGAMGSDIIANTFKGFSETDARMELFEEGKLALMRMEREIHHMVPNSIDNPNDATSIKFGLIDVNTLNSTVIPITGKYEPIGNSSKIKDLSLNELPVGSTLLSIYNTSWNEFSSNLISERKIYAITAINSPPDSMTLDKTVIGGHSSTKRYYPVQKAIRYYSNGSFLYRAETPITMAPDDFITSLPIGFPILSHIDSLTFNYTPASLTSNALVRINFTLTNKGNTLNFHKEIQVRNVP